MSTRCTRLAVSVIGLPIAFGLTGLAGCGGMQEPPAEALLPEVVDVRALSSNQIVVEFTEPVGPEADLVSSYVVRGPDSELLAVRAVEVNTARTTATLTTDDQQADTDYVLEFAGSPFGVQTFDVQTFSPPRVVGAVSTSNTTVVLTFNKNMGPSASVAANYVIVQEDVNAEAIALSVMSAAFVASQQDAVELTTVSQSEVTYRVRAVNVLDLMGSQLAPSEGGVEPDTTTFAGTPFSCGGVPCDAPDADGDGVSDAEEQLGYLVTLELMNGQLDEFEVTSDPFSADTDGDGLDDAEERSLASNPRSADTDRDGLNDFDEFNVYFSNPVSQDSDGDGLDDELEVMFYRTSPILADTDGDGFDDFQEVIESNRNPRIADLPRPGFRVGNMRIEIDERYTTTTEQGETLTLDSSSNTTMSQSQDTTFATSETDMNSRSRETFVKGGLELEFEKSFIPGKAKLSAEAGVTWKKHDEHTTQFSNESTVAAQQVFEQSLSKGRQLSTSTSVTREIVGARMDVDLSIENAGDIAFALSNIEISILQSTGLSRTDFAPIGTLVANTELITGEPATFNISSFTEELGPIIFGNRDIFPNEVDALLREPRGLIFRVANYDVTDEFGRNFAFASQTARDRTAGVTIDFGDGTVDRFLVATAGTFDQGGAAGGGFVGGFDVDTGAPLGLPLDFILRDTLRLVKNSATPDAIVAGGDGMADSLAVGDDIQLIPLDTTGLPDDAVVIAAGANDILDTTPTGDDDAVVSTGYATSPTCSVDTGLVIDPDDPEILLNGPGFPCVNDADCPNAPDASLTCIGGAFAGQPCASNLDCWTVPTCLVNTCSNSGDPCTDDAACPGTCGSTVPGVCDDGVTPCSTSDDCAACCSGTCGGGVFTCGPDTQNAGDACTVDADCLPIVGICDLGGTCDGPEVLVRVRNRRLGDFNRVWAVLSSGLIPAGADFGSIVLLPGDDITMAFVQDIDRDGILAREEYLHGSSDRHDDTDADGLGDFAEIRVGWDVGTEGAEIRQVLPNPRVEDSDGDGLSDRDEQDLRRLWCRCTGGDNDGLGCGQDGECSGGTCTCDAAAATCGDDAGLPCSSDASCATGATCIAGTGAAFSDVFSGASPSDGPVRSDPRNPDTDADGVSDMDEIAGYLIGVSVRDPEGGGGNGLADTQALSDDIQKVFVGQPVGPSRVIVLPGPNGVIDSPAGGDDVLDPGTEVVTNPLKPDFDGDTRPDGFERDAGSDPTDPNDSDDFLDSDRDGMSDAAEEDPVSGGWDVETFDINGVAEGVEHVFSSKFVADTDFDGLPDLLERELRTNPTRADTDGDGLDDFDEFAQFASFINLNDIFPGFVLDGTESLRVGTSPLRDDTDGDQLGDLFEATGGWTVLVNGETRMVTSNPLVGDTDTDGATDKEEFLGEDGAPPPASTDATDPNDPDTDGDGAFDGAELEPGGSDPLVRDLIVGVRIIGLVVHENAAPEDLQVLWAWKFTAEIPSVSPEPVEFSSSNEYQTCFPLCPGSSNCCAEHIGFGCDSTLCRESVCAQDPLCCFILWDNACVNLAESLCGSFFGSEPSCQPSTGLIFDAAGSNDQILVFDDLVDFTDECGGHEVLFALSEGQAIRLNFKLTSPVSAALCDPAFQPSECSVSVNEVRSFEQLLEAPNWQEVVVDLGEGSPFACSDSSATIAIIRH